MERQGEVRPAERSNNLRIDNVLSTQPELGPNIPDGGYGWIILLGALFFQLTVPSLSVAYGVFLMFSSLEESYGINNLKDGNIFLWDNVMIYTPILFFALWTITDPMCRLIVANSRWPRLVGLGGTSLLCAGILFFWLAVVNPHLYHEFLYSVGGAISGIGAALVITQCEVLLTQFFRLKLVSVNLIAWIASIFGFAITPVVLGYFINLHGLPHVIIWYHLYILTGVMVCGMFKKPDYLKSKTYGPVGSRNFDGDEEDIFSKNGTELKIARHQIVQFNKPNEEPSTSSVQEGHPDWEKFSDDDDEELRANGIKVSSGNRSPDINPPRDLFTELQLNNNTTYSFDHSNVVNAVDDTHVFMPILPPSGETYKFLLQPTFYKTLYLHITLKYSIFAFCTAYPSMLYFSISYLHKESVTSIMGYVFCSCVIPAITVKWVKINQVNRVFFISFLAWTSCIGFYMIGGSGSLSGKIIGGIITAMSIFTMEQFSEPYLKLHIKSEPTKRYIYLNLLSGLSVCLLTLVDMNLVRFFQIIGTMQFLNGTIWFGNYVLKRLKGEE